MVLFPVEIGPLNPEVPDLVVAGLLFPVCFLAMARLLLPRARRVIAEREDALDGGLRRAEASWEEARQVREEYERLMAEARHEAARIRQAAVEEGGQLIGEARAVGLREREELVAAGRSRIAAQRAAAEEALRGDIEALAVELAGRILGEEVTARGGGGRPSTP
ncbi:hypothetical protein ACFVGY_19915 [Streptomyces sp. NPDC127106]|uniref:F0F1 ATP synthase subunit B family protein n=1 Tax=Streptomyces sp. NPDC127106 TaxID=3345360 RepID=UPI00362E2BF0